MDLSEQRTSRVGGVDLLAFVFFYICYYLYLLKIVRTDLIYQSFGRLCKFPEFSKGLLFLREHLGVPGGLLEYAEGLLSQCYYHSWLGGLIVTLIAVCLSVCVVIFFRSKSAKGSAYACFVPAVVLLIPFNRYDHQLPAILSITLAVVCFVVYATMTLKGLGRIVVFVVTLAVLYYFGGGTCFYFATLAIMYEVFLNRNLATGSVLLLFCAGVYAAGAIIFDYRPQIILLRELSVQAISDKWIRLSVLGLYMFFPLILICLGITGYFKRNRMRRPRPKRQKGRETPGLFWKLFCNRTSRFIIQVLVIATASILICRYSFNPRLRNEMQISYYAGRRMWKPLLQKAATLKAGDFNLYMNHDVNRALYHAGLLGDRMFAFPQKTAALTLSESESRFSANSFDKRCDFFLDIGHVGMARRLDHEALEVSGNSPYVLKRLALINIVKGQTEAARVFLHALSKDLIFGKWATRYLVQLDKDPEQKNSALIEHIRSITSQKDNTTVTINADDFFVQLLRKNRQNKMAFEYMMAYCLLTRQVHKVAANLQTFRELGYEKIPLHFEEAIAIYLASGAKIDNLHGYTINRAAVSKIKAFDRMFVQFGGARDRQTAKTKLAKDYAGRYIFYYAFDVSGAVR